MDNMVDKVNNRFNKVNLEDVIKGEVFARGAKPCLGVLSRDLNSILWQNGTLDYPSLMQSRNLLTIFEVLGIHREQVASVLNLMSDLNKGKCNSYPLELKMEGSEKFFHLFTFMKRDSGLIQFTIMAQRSSINSLHNIGITFLFINFGYLKRPKGIPTNEFEDYRKLVYQTNTLSNEEYGRAISCIKKLYATLGEDLNSHDRNSSGGISLGYTHNNQWLNNSLKGEERGFLRPLREQIADQQTLMRVSHELKYKLLHTYDFVRNAIPTFILGTSGLDQDEGEISILNGNNKGQFSGYRELFFRLGIFNPTQQDVFTEAVLNQNSQETFITTDKGVMVMQSKPNITGEGWQSTVMPVGDNSENRRKGESPVGHLKLLCMEIECLNLEYLTNDEVGKSRFGNIFDVMGKLMEECVSNLKKGILENVWSNIGLMNNLLSELKDLISKRKVPG